MVADKARNRPNNAFVLWEISMLICLCKHSSLFRKCPAWLYVSLHMFYGSSYINSWLPVPLLTSSLMQVKNPAAQTHIYALYAASPGSSQSSSPLESNAFSWIKWMQANRVSVSHGSPGKSSLLTSPSHLLTSPDLIFITLALRKRPSNLGNGARCSFHTLHLFIISVSTVVKTAAFGTIVLF